ncbi:MAG TPA: hypothetical protein VFG51_00510 [Candidatus Saccharimonadia bacterium]|nr:hypothetical protein [Candidatus Saccharimonadia bacterium]
MLAKVLLKWFPLALIVIAMSGLAYLLTQQTLRMSASDPQIQLSEDIANNLSAGQDPKSLVLPQQIDIAKSISPYITVYDDHGVVLVSTATLDGTAPKLPPGVLEFTKLHHQDRVTWQPRSEVREAIVVTRFESTKSSGFVLAGRSLREVEVRESQVFSLAVLAGGSTILILLVLTYATVQIKMALRGQVKSEGKKRHAH